MTIRSFTHKRNGPHAEQSNVPRVADQPIVAYECHEVIQVQSRPLTSVTIPLNQKFRLSSDVYVLPGFVDSGAAAIRVDLDHVEISCREWLSSCHQE